MKYRFAQILIKRYYSTQKKKNVSLKFFTKESCQLCKNARAILDSAIKESSDCKIDLKVVDIMKPENSEAFDMYCYDVPVLHIHKDESGKPIKFMHYFDSTLLKQEFSK